jgi:methylenetetrahydrofolate reductase (NADPH)
LAVSNIRRIVLTHAHEDHCGLARSLRDEAKDAEVFVHNWETGHRASRLEHDESLRLLQRAGVPEEEIQSILARYAGSAIGNILALGGDRPRNIPYDKATDSFQHAVDLVKFIRKFNESGAHPDRRGFGIGVAGFPEGHPATPNRLVEMDHLKAKVDAGADYIVTQLFFDNRDFLDFRERCALAGIHVPIIAGIMPITSMSGFKRIAELAGGARFPAKLLRALQRCENNREMVSRVGVHFALEQCHDLLDNDVAGIHFYTLNRSDATRTIFDSLGIPRQRNAQVPIA